jgi:Xaa-Pro dipeptidase
MVDVDRRTELSHTRAVKALFANHIDVLSQRYAAALSHAGFDAVVLHSGSPKKRSEVDDQYFALRAMPPFQHWVALDQPDAFVVFAAGRRPVLVWPEQDSYWERPRVPDMAHVGDSLEVVRPTLGSLAAGPDTAALRYELRTRVQALTSPPRRVALIVEEPRLFSNYDFAEVNPPELVRALDELRVHKTAYELACLREANEVACRGHRAVLDAFDQGEHSELSLHLLYLGATLQDDPETPYKNIVALGENAATLHHISYGRSKVDASSLLLDAGATVRGYCSDITRTAVRGRGELVDVFRAMVTALDAAQRKLCDRVALGVPYEQLHDQAHREVSDILADVGLVRASADEIDATGISRVFLPHGLGHSLGLQCHDVGCALVKPSPRNPALRNTRAVERDQVFTIEPGIYFIRSLLEKLRAEPRGAAVDWTLVERLIPFGGIRIEDDLWVRETGHDNMTRAFLP